MEGQIDLYRGVYLHLLQLISRLTDRNMPLTTMFINTVFYSDTIFLIITQTTSFYYLLLKHNF